MNGKSRQIIAKRYVLQDKLQAGGMTTVYRARDLESDELVAVKRFDRDRHLPEIEQEAFRREVDALRRLTHPNIVRLLDAGEDEDGKFFAVLELMKHDLVEERNRRGAAFNGWDDLAELVVLPLLHALSYAHEVGIAHRDVKPANVLVSSDGTVKLADFGISKLKRTLQPRLTLSDFMSPPFAPPEPDRGGDTYGRDVYSIGVLCLWALSDHHLADYSDLPKAIAAFDAPPEIDNVIQRVVAANMTDRFQSAALLAAEIERVQLKRRQYWLQQEQVRCAIGLTNRAREKAAEELEFTDSREVERFIADDLNTDACIQRFIENYGAMNERVKPDHYMVVGSTLRYHIAQSDRGYDSFTVINVFRPELHVLQRNRENAPPSPVRFEFDSRTGTVAIRDAISRIEQAIEAFDQLRQETERQERETELFDTWLRVLDAKMLFERERSKPLLFKRSSVDGTFVALEVTHGTNGIEVGELRFVELDDGRRIRGEVWETSPNAVVLNCPLGNLSDFPKQGAAKLDLYALQVAVDRQRNAIDQIRSGTNAAPRLRELLLEPINSALPRTDVNVSAEIMDMLDDSKQRALQCALASDDITIIHGPPGTGKTQLIVALVLAELNRNARARILLSSQTHIAIDNALERLSKYLVEGRILRIARDSAGRVREGAEPFLIDNQLKRWRLEVTAKALSGLETWAGNHGLNPTDIRTGAVVRQVAATRRRVDQTRECIHAEEQRKRGLEGMKQMLSKSAWELEMETVKEDLQELRDRLEAEKKQLSLVEDRLKKVRKDGDTLLQLSPDDQDEWANVLRGETNLEQTAERLINIQSEWLDRFGASRGFWRPLIERSSVVASTCVGLSAIDEMDDVVFDLCIIDEASKATAMEACVPMARCRRWVLVGDSKQLPPFQEEILAKPSLRERFDLLAEDASESIFERMRRKLPAACQVRLQKQYRMVEPIGRMISECFYAGELQSHKETIDAALCSIAKRAVNWFSTRALPKKEEQPAGTSFVNAEEAAIISELLFDLDDALASSHSPSKRTVLALSGYGAQVNHLEQRIRNVRPQLRHLRVECCTVDRVQGRESDVVLFSVTRSNPSRTAGFLAALERINVALSRACELLVIVGDDGFVDYAQDAAPLQRILRHVRECPAECAVVNVDAYRRQRAAK